MIDLTCSKENHLKKKKTTTEKDYIVIKGLKNFTIPLRIKLVTMLIRKNLTLHIILISTTNIDTFFHKMVYHTKPSRNQAAVLYININ